MKRMMWIVTLSVAAALSAPLPAATSQRPNFVFIPRRGARLEQHVGAYG